MRDRITEDRVRETIEEIMGSLECPEHFKCTKSGFDVLCKARRVGMNNYLECLESNPTQCKFASPLLDVYHCECPVRECVFEKLKR